MKEDNGRRTSGAERRFRSRFDAYPEFRNGVSTGALVLVASPSAEVRRRWSRELCGTFLIHSVGDGVSLRASISALKPSLLVLDLDMPGLGGIGGLLRLRRLSDGTRILLLSASPDPRRAVPALRAGAWGYCGKELDPSLMRKAVETVQKGEVWVSRSVVQYLLQETLGGVSRKRELPALANGPLRLLTARKKEVAFLIAEGASNKEIASRLEISEKTVKAHLTAIFRKLGVGDRLHLALLVTANGQTTGPAPHLSRV